MRTVIDTNVVISSILFSNSKSGKAIRKAKIDGVILSSEKTNDECRSKIANAKFDRYATPEERACAVEQFVENSLKTKITKSVRACRDPKDDKFLELAVSGNANYIVTGDKDLLVLSPFRGIPILTPAQFLEISS